jgi:hypothetical protein
MSERRSLAHLARPGCNVLAAGLALLIVMLFALGPWEELRPFLLVLPVVAAGYLIYRRSAIRKLGQLTNAWTDLARQTGLVFTPGTVSRLGIHSPPSLAGEYRGHRVAVSKIVQHQAAGESTIPAVYTRISIQVDNPGNFSFSLDPMLLGLFRRGRASATGDAEFDRRFRVKGHPPEFKRSATGLLVNRRDLLIRRPREVIMLTDSPLAWRSWGRPSIRLQGSDLSCFQSGVPTEVDHQIAVLNLLCDLAGQVEGGPRR